MNAIAINSLPFFLFPYFIKSTSYVLDLKDCEPGYFMYAVHGVISPSVNLLAGLRFCYCHFDSTSSKQGLSFEPEPGLLSNVFSFCVYSVSLTFVDKPF